MGVELLTADRSALEAMARKPLEIWMESTDAACAAATCLNLAERGLCTHARLNATLGRFTITEAGRQYLATAGNA